MKSLKMLGAALVILIHNAIAVHAADLFLVTLKTTCRSFDGDRLVSSRSSTTSILRDYAAAQEPALNVRDLRLVFEPATDRIVIANTSGEILTDVMGFGGSTAIANTTDTRRERHAFVFLGESSEASGSALISERLTRDNSDAVVRMTSRGSFQYVEAATAETPAQICAGTFSIGKKLAVRIPPPTTPEG